MWAFRSIPTLEALNKMQKECICCHSKLNLVEVLDNSKKAWLCRTCKDWLLERGCVKRTFNPTLRNHVEYILVKEISECLKRI